MYGAVADHLHERSLCMYMRIYLPVCVCVCVCMWLAYESYVCVFTWKRVLTSVSAYACYVCMCSG